ncbi:MAG: hypothetical protein ACI318_03810 [Bacilli bacterium]|nr:hypothetical protein [Erysipelotrichaceae bacterium]MDD6249850.1 hypothetical protein [Bacillales bacterium]MDY2746873.1 hypothetical protein [Bacilli bacterium]MDD7381451.1 hypothetical protein [Bacillales bacterium]MDY3890814.1 hypothetical protein [Bacilli bacterium]
MDKFFNIKILFTMDLWVVALLITSFIFEVSFDSLSWIRSATEIIFFIFIGFNVLLFISLFFNYISLMKEEKNKQI